MNFTEKSRPSLHHGVATGQWTGQKWTGQSTSLNWYKPMLSIVPTLFFTWTLFANAVAQSTNIKTVEIIQNFDVLQESQMFKYQSIGGACLTSDEKLCNFFVIEFCAKVGKDQRCILQSLDESATQARKNNDELSLKPEDSLLFRVNSHERILDSNDTNCKSSQFPRNLIWAVGNFKWLKSHYGRAEKIVAAWSIDKITGKFFAINPRTVKCVIAENRN